MQTIGVIKELLAIHGLAPRKSLGQNFLIDQNHITNLVAASGVTAGSVVLEVGPGTGTLTEALLDNGARVIACELDRGLAQLLRDRLGERRGFSLIEGDCLASKHEINPAITDALGRNAFQLVANLPYAAATPLIATLITEHPRCTSLHVTIQKEVAQRLRAQPGTREYGELSVLTQALCHVSRIATLPPSCFWPRPKVTSEMISITRLAHPRTEEPRSLQALCDLLFSQRRKQIGSLLPRGAEVPAGIDPRSRAEALSIDQLVQLSAVLATEPG